MASFCLSHTELCHRPRHKGTSRNRTRPRCGVHAVAAGAVQPVGRAVRALDARPAEGGLGGRAIFDALSKQQHLCCRFIGGHGIEPNEQNTQQRLAM